MNMERIFIITYPAGKGLSGADVRILSKSLFIHKDRRLPSCYNRKRVRVGTPDGRHTKRVSAVTLHEFRMIFTEEDIETMRSNGMLDYYPNDRYIFSRYPLFRAEIYKVYGIKKERQ